MRRLMKFLHTMGAIGLMGAMACLVALLCFLPSPASLSEYALMRAAMGGIATWIFLPSFGLTLVSGLLAMALNRGYQNAGWAWVKLASGLVDPGMLAAPHVLIWVISAWALVPASMIMRGMAMLRISGLIAQKRRAAGRDADAAMQTA